MEETRAALIIAVSEYQDAGLRQLVAPTQDAQSLARVLEDPAIGGFTVKTLLNQPAHQVNRDLEAFFANRHKDDLLLLYFSGHGLKDEEGRLYFATTDTDRKFLRSTAVAATLLNDVMHHSRSRRQVLILDCCYSGAFARGMIHRADETVGTGEYFKEGRGQFVLTASDALQYAFEGDAVQGTGMCSVFTDTLVRGLETGAADRDQDGHISCDELYDYLHEHVTDRLPQQRPRKWTFNVEGDLIIARNPRPTIKPAVLPAELQQSLEDTRPWVREGAARHLGELLQHTNPRLAWAAHAALQQMTDDDSLKVRTVVAELLTAYAAAKPPLTALQGSDIALSKEEAETQRQAEEIWRQAEEARQAEKAQRQAPAVRQADARQVKTPPTLPAIRSIHGWSAQQDLLQTLQQQTAQALGLTVEFRDSLKDGRSGPLMVVIPGGRFLMGSPENEPDRSSDERQHEVEVKPFAIGKYAVTFEEYDRFAEAAGREKPSDEGWGRERRPVINITWFNALAYTEWLSQQTGQTYRLPTEAEWEYACRAGTPTAYHFGASIRPDLANYVNRVVVVSNGGFFKKLFEVDQIKYVGEKRTVEVGRYPANVWGLYDMHGNVVEWTGSVYEKNYNGSEQRCVEPNTTGPCVLRGGSWNDGPRGLRGTARIFIRPHFWSAVGGFRLARTFSL